MVFFHKIEKIIRKAGKSENSVEKASENMEIDVDKEIVLSPSSHIAEEEMDGDDVKYLISFEVNNAFKETKSHAGEVEMLHTYAPVDEYGEEGRLPYLAIQFDDEVYNAVEEFKESGTFAGAMEITKLSNKFYFKAKMEYYEDIMYFYAMDRCDGFWENNGLCIVYPREYVGTKEEQKIIGVLDEAAKSYCEKRN